jgi:hypothetical protein
MSEAHSSPAEPAFDAFLSFAAELDVAWEALDVIAARLRERLGEARLHHIKLPYVPGAQDQVRQF